MKRFHVHLSVPDLGESIRFYSSLFGAEPTVRKDDYAKWIIDEPRVNFAISQRGSGRTGLNHLGLQAESAEELAGIRTQFERADAGSTVAEPGANCCYVRSDKHWVTDPQGIAWEAFHTLETISSYQGEAQSQATAGCCTTAATKTQCCTPMTVASGAEPTTERACC